MQEHITKGQAIETALDLNDLRVFAYVASLASFSLAANALKVHKSSVSRSIARLETSLESPLLQRTTRKVRLTQRGIALNARCIEILSRISETISYVGNIEEDALGLHPLCTGKRSRWAGDY
jgi:DNA-binding transcriptional LysR family regulator